MTASDYCSVKLKTLTPIWTGGVNTTMQRIQETGVLGSMRWWFEVFLRGIGAEVCDQKTRKCSFDADKYKNPQRKGERQRLLDAGLCDVCQVFGATGWRRRFRLTIEENLSDATITSPISIKINQHKSRWYPPRAKQGEFTIHVRSLSPDFPPEIIAGLLQFMADWAAIGAKAQMGFGVVQVVGNRIETKALSDWLQQRKGSGEYPSEYLSLPSLRNIFLARIKLVNEGNEGDMFRLKYDLRGLFRKDPKDTSLRHFIMGSVKPNRTAAKVKMSLPYEEGLMRVWGWIPEKADEYRGEWNRSKVVETIRQHLEDKYEMIEWWEIEDPWSFLQKIPKENGR